MPPTRIWAAGSRTTCCTSSTEPVNGQGYAAPNTASPVGVLEWDAAAYFQHQPDLRLTLTNQTASLTWPSQPGWGYRLEVSSDLVNWTEERTMAGTNGMLNVTLTNVPSACTFWRLKFREGGL